MVSLHIYPPYTLLHPFPLLNQPRLILVVMYFAVFCLQVGHEAVPGRYPIPSAPPPSIRACGSATKRGLGCKTGGYTAKLAHLPGYGLTPILGQSPPHNNIIPPPTPAVYLIIFAGHDIEFQNIQRTDIQLQNKVLVLCTILGLIINVTGILYWLYRLA